MRIVAFDVERRAVGLSTGRRVLLKAVAKGVVVDERPGAPLVTAVAACWTAAELKDHSKKRALLRDGFPAEKLAPAPGRAAVIAFLDAIRASRSPCLAGAICYSRARRR